MPGGTIASNSAGSSAGREPRVESPGSEKRHPVGAVSGPGIARAESVAVQESKSDGIVDTADLESTFHIHFDEFASLLSVPAVADCSMNSSLEVHSTTSNFAFLTSSSCASSCECETFESTQHIGHLLHGPAKSQTGARTNLSEEDDFEIPECWKQKESTTFRRFTAFIKLMFNGVMGARRVTFDEAANAETPGEIEDDTEMDMNELKRAYEMQTEIASDTENMEKESLPTGTAKMIMSKIHQQTIIIMMICMCSIIAMHGVETIEVDTLTEEQKEKTSAGVKSKQTKLRLKRGITMDSGAGNNVMPRRMVITKYEIRDSEGSRRGVHYVAANDGRIPNEGEYDLKFSTVEGQEQCLTF